MGLLEVKVVAVGIDPRSRAFFVALKDQRDSVLPILIGSFEAEGISSKLLGEDPSRPSAYDTIKNILDATGSKVTRLVVNDLAEDTFFAQVTLNVSGREFSLDCRPSDGIALSLRCEAPLYVAEHVMKRAGGPVKLVAEERSGNPKWREAEAEPGQSKLEELMVKLRLLVEQEDYDQAAVVRDQIMKLQQEDA